MLFFGGSPPFSTSTSAPHNAVHTTCHSASVPSYLSLGSTPHLRHQTPSSPHHAPQPYPLVVPRIPFPRSLTQPDALRTTASTPTWFYISGLFPSSIAQFIPLTSKTVSLHLSRPAD
ncbi:hypothetical protein FA13DRAFT_1738049, partial [Coprinellus micaceus]